MVANGDYCTSVRVDARRVAEDPRWWERVKCELIQKFLSELFPKMIDDGQYHVMKFDYYKVYPYQEQFFRLDQFAEFYLVCCHYIAQTKQYVVPELPKTSFSVPENYVARKVCQFCGNEWNPDYRGSCRACGGWPKDGDPQG